MIYSLIVISFERQNSLYNLTKLREWQKFRKHRTAPVQGQHHCNVYSKIASIYLQVIGNQRAPTMSDRGKMIYTEATLLEVQRIVTIGETSSEWHHPTAKSKEIKQNIKLDILFNYYEAHYITSETLNSSNWYLSKHTHIWCRPMACIVICHIYIYKYIYIWIIYYTDVCYCFMDICYSHFLIQHPWPCPIWQLETRPLVAIQSRRMPGSFRISTHVIMTTTCGATRTTSVLNAGLTSTGHCANTRNSSRFLSVS